MFSKKPYPKLLKKKRKLNYDIRHKKKKKKPHRMLKARVKGLVLYMNITYKVLLVQVCNP